MNYEKLTVDRFVANLKDGKYAGLTGSRRAIGKTDWSKKDRETAHAAADKHFSKAGAATKGKTPKKAKSAAVKKVAKAKPAKRAAAAKPAAAPKAAAPTASAPAPKPVREPVTASSRLMNDDPGAVRQHSASTVIAAFRNSGTLNPLEQRAYDVATASYSTYAQPEELKALSALSPSAPAAPKAARGRAPATRQPRTAAAPPAEDTAATPAVSAKELVAPPGAPRIAVPPPMPSTVVAPPAVSNGTELDLDSLTPEEQAQHERLRRAALASGQAVPGSS